MIHGARHIDRMPPTQLWLWWASQHKERAMSQLAQARHHTSATRSTVVAWARDDWHSYLRYMRQARGMQA